MRAPLERALHQWADAGVIDQQTADRIRAFESALGITRVGEIAIRPLSPD
jgi:hypothetical protein